MSGTLLAVLRHVLSTLGIGRACCVVASQILQAIRPDPDDDDDEEDDDDTDGGDSEAAGSAEHPDADEDDDDE